jgi:hypothetical protein
MRSTLLMTEKFQYWQIVIKMEVHVQMCHNRKGKNRSYHFLNHYQKEKYRTLQNPNSSLSKGKILSLNNNLFKNLKGILSPNSNL